MNERKDCREGRFAFGRNWSHYLAILDNERIEQAKVSLGKMLDMENLEGKTFLDIGSGSGLFSLAARLMGARVTSFDYDPLSVACTNELKKRYFPDDRDWFITEGSVLDEDFITSLGKFDVVYSWGVLHHTGDMLRAFEHTITLMNPTGKLFIAIYNDQGLISRYWHFMKKMYNFHPIFRIVTILFHAPYLLGLRFLARMLTGRLTLERGMSLWYDMNDWLGGYPFEVATPEFIFEYFKAKGLSLDKMKTCAGRLGCNEYVFKLER